MISSLFLFAKLVATSHHIASHQRWRRRSISRSARSFVVRRAMSCRVVSCRVSILLLLLLLVLVVVLVLVLAGIPKRKAIEEMAMADPIRPAPSELVDGALHVIAAALDQVADEEVAGAVESVVAVDAHHHVLVFAPVVGLLLRGRPLLLVLPDLVH